MQQHLQEKLHNWIEIFSPQQSRCIYRRTFMYCIYLFIAKRCINCKAFLNESIGGSGGDSKQIEEIKINRRLFPFCNREEEDV